MSVYSGVQPVATYTGSTTAAAAIDKLIALIPDPDAAHGTGSRPGGQAGQGGAFLDEMSPAAAVQIRVELNAMRAVVGAFNAP